MCIITGLIIISYTINNIVLIISSLFYGYGYGMTQPVLQTWGVNIASQHRLGAANGTFLSAVDIGVGVGASIFGMNAN